MRFMLQSLLALTVLACAVVGQEIQSLRPNTAQPEVKGIEEADNGFRHKTPALNRAHMTRSYVDVNQLVDHKRNLFGNSTGEVLVDEVDLVESEAAAPAPTPRKKRSKQSHGDPWPWVGGILAVMAIMLLVLIRATGRAPVARNADRFVITSRS